MQAVAYGLVGGFLHCGVKRSVNAQSLFVDGCGAVGVFEIFANVFDEVRSEVVASRKNVQTERLFCGGRSLRRGDFVVASHERENKIASREGALRMVDRRVNRSADDCRERGGFGK